jgi:hypothetical protein
MKNITYHDVLMMPTYERRFFLGLLLKSNTEREEHYENMKQDATTKNSKGQRTTTVSGEALKNKFKNGQIPTK